LKSIKYSSLNLLDENYLERATFMVLENEGINQNEIKSSSSKAKQMNKFMKKEINKITRNLRNIERDIKIKNR